ncbi:hypothetical protein RI367_006031 [Sorochytrium milnesiophthora]
MSDARGSSPPHAKPVPAAEHNDQPPPPPPRSTSPPAPQPTLSLDSLQPHHADALREYLAGNLTRREYERALEPVTDEQARQVNAFILGVLHNAIIAQANVPPPTSAGATAGHPSAMVRKRRKLETPEQRKQRIKVEVASLSKYDRDRIRVAFAEQSTAAAASSSSSAASGSAGSASRRLMLSVPAKYAPPNIPSALQPDYNRALLASRTCQEQQQLPEKQTLRDRMQVIAYENDITGVSDDSVHYLSLGLEIYLKNILSAAIRKKRRISTPIVEVEEPPQVQTAAAPQVPARSPQKANGLQLLSNGRRRRTKSTDTGSLSSADKQPTCPPPAQPSFDYHLCTMDDLECAYYLNPSKFGELPHTAERIMATLWHDTTSLDVAGLNALANAALQDTRSPSPPPPLKRSPHSGRDQVPTR